ncbi:MAG: Gfo/Idh/MocA family oxidoreductase [Chthonomonadales bacterium]|nr:Gfo/Idh/MocA family oxidoreductase [Chthonomonadales bacterium]
MADRVGIGVVGCGSVSHQYMALARTLESEGLCATVAACDTDEGKRELARETWGLPVFTTDYRELVVRADVDLVLVLTPMREHARVARAALLAGRHALVEKPMASSLAEAAGLVELARTVPGLLICAPHTVVSPTFRAIAERLDAGDIGRVLTARARYGWAGPSWGKWFYQPGGGVLFDLGVYNLTTLTGWLGPARRVMAMTGVAIPERTVDGERIRVEAEDNAQVLLDLGDSVFASITTGFTMQSARGPAIELYGSRGVLQMLGDDWAPRGYEMWRGEQSGWETVAETDPGWPWTAGLRHALKCIRAGEPPRITPEHAYHVLEIMLRAQESGRDGRAHDLTSRFELPR